MPASFIRTLESGSHMDALTRVILKKASAACRTWRKLACNATVSVNLSLSMLEDLTLADRLAATVTQAGIQPRDVVLEVTETAAATRLGHVLENLARTRLMGFGLAIDDYGTGYSSMQQLARIPFTELKIDQSFVRDSATNRTSRAVLESSLEISHKLGIRAVAEGVENQSEANLLRELGCAEGQGYLIGRPLPAQDFEGWVRAGARTGLR
jgi:EAL domain-containing protein (putative c-di-GMP-specific phosphodiesterase class I)